MNKLELCKAIADIDGVSVSLASWGKLELMLISNSTKREEYNPLTNKALLFDLEYKYDVSTCRYGEFVYIESEYADRPHKASISFSSKEDKPRAILECIVEANQ